MSSNPTSQPPPQPQLQLTKHAGPSVPPSILDPSSENEDPPLPTMSSFLSAFDPSPQRLSLHPIIRIPMITTLATLAGFGLGFSHGGPLATYQYRAENAHRFPTTSAGWYLYHRTKGYHAVVGGMKHGAKMAGVLGGSVGLFLFTEYAVDRARGEWGRGGQDVGSTVVAGATIGGAWAAVKARGEVYPAARMVRMGVKGAVVYGFAQDGMAWLRANPPGYVRWVMGLLGKSVTDHATDGANF